MALTWNRITGSAAALHADSIRTELGFHLMKSWHERLRKQKRERSEHGFNRHTSKPNSYGGIQLYTPSLLQFTVVNVLLVLSFSSWVGATQPHRPCLASASR